MKGDLGDAAAVEILDVVRYSGDRVQRSTDALSVEEPLEIRLAGLSVAVTMRTPGDDVDLVTGFLVTEGIVASASDIASIAECEGEGSNVVNANLRDPSGLDPGRWKRNFYASSSCGVCGKATIDAIRIEVPRILAPWTVSLDILIRLEVGLARVQQTFQRTGGLHAAAVFDRQGALLAGREDVGRHNAVDKVIGHLLRDDPRALSSSIIMVSGRASFEVVQKALKAGIPVVAAVSAPSSLAVDLARETGMTLVGFLRSGRCNVYSGAERITTTGVKHAQEAELKTADGA